MNKPSLQTEIAPVEILAVIEAHYNGMSPAQRAVADFITNNPATFCFLSVQELAEKALVSHATVIRFCKAIGYQGFAEFSKDVQQTVQQSMLSGQGSINNMQIVQDFLDSPTDKQPLLQHVLNMEIQSLLTVTERISKEQIASCIELMAQADYIFIVGQMASAPFALHMEQILSRVANNVYLVPPKSAKTAILLQRVSHRSVIIGYAFPRYPAFTIEFAKQAVDRGASLIAITNSPLSPLAKISSISLYAPVGVLSYIDLYSAPLAISNILALEFSNRFPERTAEKLTEYDKAAKEQSLYLNS